MITACNETITHFNCDCGRWFSIAGFEPSNVHNILCPYCGYKQNVGEIKNSITGNNFLEAKQ